MVKFSAKRGLFLRVVCLLSVALVCAISIAQAVHAHPDDSTNSHHTCSLCLTAYAEVSMEALATAPVLVATTLATPTAESADIFRPADTHFIRPPPAF